MSRDIAGGNQRHVGAGDRLAATKLGILSRCIGTRYGMHSGTSPALRPHGPTQATFVSLASPGFKSCVAGEVLQPLREHHDLTFDEENIYYVASNGREKSVPITGLKDRLSRIRKARFRGNRLPRFPPLRSSCYRKAARRLK